MKRAHCIKIAGLILVMLAFGAFGTHAAIINFSGPLKYIVEEYNGAVYFDVDDETIFSGSIDDETFGGYITDGTTLTTFAPPQISAEGVSILNDKILTAVEAEMLNAVEGNDRYSEGDVVDGVDIEGDAATASGGRIEIGLSYVFGSDAFDNEGTGNYPVDMDQIQTSLWFIYESDSNSDDLYSVVGQIVPIPASLWLLGAGLATIFGLRSRKHKNL